MADVVGQLTGLIPIAIAGGIVMKFTGAMMPKSKQTRKRKKSYRRKSSPRFGDFSNIGF